MQEIKAHTGATSATLNNKYKNKININNNKWINNNNNKYYILPKEWNKQQTGKKEQLLLKGFLIEGTGISILTRTAQKRDNNNDINNNLLNNNNNNNQNKNNIPSLSSS